MTTRDPNLDLHAMLTVIGHEADAPQHSDREVEAAVAHWSTVFEPLNAIAQPVRAPQHVWSRIEASVQADLRKSPQAAPPRMASSLWQCLWASVDVWRFAAASAVTAALLIAVLGRSTAPMPTSPAFVAVLQAPDGDRRPGFLVEVAADRSVRLVPLGKTDIASGRALQFWTLVDPSMGPQSLGLVPGNSVTSLPANSVPAVTGNQLFEITLEPAAGSPIGRPTGPVLFVGRISTI